jgi:hypothetical protein
VLEAPDDGALSDVLAEERDRIARDLTAREQALRSIERLARAPEAVRYDVALAPKGARRLAGVSGLVRADRLGPDTAELCGRAIAMVTPAGLPVHEGLIATFPSTSKTPSRSASACPSSTTAPCRPAPSSGSWRRGRGHRRCTSAPTTPWRSRTPPCSSTSANAATSRGTHRRDLPQRPSTVPPAELLTRLSVRV